MTRKTRKGQSAIEYLMTYGWMLLVVAIVGGAIFATVQNEQNSCQKEIMDIKVPDDTRFGVSSFGSTASNVQIALQNNNQEDVTVNSVTLDGETASSSPSDPTVGTQEKSWTFDQFNQSSSCNEFEVQINYEKGPVSDTITGTLKGEMARK